MNNTEKKPKRFTPNDLPIEHREAFDQTEEYLFEIFKDSILEDIKYFKENGHGNYKYGIPYFNENKTEFFVPFEKL